MDFVNSFVTSATFPPLGDPSTTEYACDLLAYSGLTDDTSIFADSDIFDDHAAQYLLPDFDHAMWPTISETVPTASEFHVSYEGLVSLDSASPRVADRPHALTLSNEHIHLNDPMPAPEDHIVSDQFAYTLASLSLRSAAGCESSHELSQSYDPLAAVSFASLSSTPELPSSLSVGSIGPNVIDFSSDEHDPAPHRDHGSRSGHEARYSPYVLPSPVKKKASSHSKGERKSALERKEAPSRHHQFKQDAGEPTLLPPVGSNRCPLCDHVQANSRRTDLNRHIMTHYPKGYCCGGLALERAQASGLTKWSPVTEHEWEGVTYVGGCLRGFSRRDSLRRHLMNINSCCFGDLNASFQPVPKKLSASESNALAWGRFGVLR